MCPSPQLTLIRVKFIAVILASFWACIFFLKDELTQRKLACYVFRGSERKTIAFFFFSLYILNSGFPCNEANISIFLLKWCYLTPSLVFKSETQGERSLCISSVDCGVWMFVSNVLAILKIWMKQKSVMFTWLLNYKTQAHFFLFS